MQTRTEAFVISSNAFQHNNNIPKKYTCDGENISPQLSWSGVPVGTKSFVLIMHDPDAPSGDFVHWVLFDIPVTDSSLKENIGIGKVVKDGVTSFAKIGYGGPCPPSGTHRYYFEVFALSVSSLGLSEGADRKQVEAAMAKHILGKAVLMGKYSRQGR